MKTQSLRIKENNKSPGQMTILAIVFAFVFSPIGLIFCFLAKKEGKSTVLTVAWIFSIIGTVLWGIMIIWWIIGAFAFFAFFH